VRVRLLVAYDGSPFHGFAENQGVATVAGTLRGAVERVLGCPVTLTGAGRTDTGVHAWGQVVSFDAADDVDLERLQKSVNSMCGPAIAVREATRVSETFDARFSARWRRYRYTILTGAAPSPFLASTAWHVTDPLDVAAMRLACDPLIGEHDFASFCRAPPGGTATLVRRVLAASWQRDGGDILTFDIRATSFCHQMVRSIVGLHVDVGRGRRHAGDVLAILRARDRAAMTANIAPPHGLCLWAVGY
jgi:tRNA pseudouridine38-40 synthase